jgi:hypothetical protein
LLLAARRSHLVLYAPSATFVPNLLFWFLSSNSSMHVGQRKSATGLLFGKRDIFAFPQCGQQAQAVTQVSV